MSNGFYNPSGAPVTSSFGASASIRAEFTAIGAGFDKLPAVLTANKAVVVNAGGTGMTLTTGALALAGDLTTTGAFNTMLAQQASITITLPLTTDTLVGRATTDTLTNKTLTSPTMTAPVLGTPASGVLTNCTGLPIATGVSGLAANIAAFMATPTSANLAAALTDETGTGANVFATSPTLVTPLLGTPTSGVLTNCTGLPIATGVSGLAANVATFLATPTSANLRAVLTDETGAGAAVFANSPTLVTPNIGVASGTSLSLSLGLTTQGDINCQNGSINSGNNLTATGFGQLVTIGGLELDITAGGGAVQWDIVPRINGVRLTDGATAWSAVCDYRSKDTYGFFTGSGTIIDAVPVHLAQLKNKTQPIRPMFIAHEVAEGGATFAVTGTKDAVNEDGSSAMQVLASTDPLVPVLWAEIRDLRRRMAIQETKTEGAQ